MKTTLSLLLSLLLVSSCRGEDYLKDKITPNFTLLKRNQEFEKREYEPTTWLRTSVESADSAGISKAHGHLKSFVENAQNNIEAEGIEDLDKTWPVLINHTKDNQLWLCWFVPPKLKLSSGDSLVEIFQLPKSIFYVRKFNGLPSIKAGKENTKKLLASLDRSCPDLDLVEYSGAGYESFFSLWHHNEVLISQNSSCTVAG